MPDTEAGRALHARIFGLNDRMPSGKELDEYIAAIEREAAARALAEVADHVARLRESEWRQCTGDCHGATIAAVLDIIEELPRE